MTIARAPTSLFADTPGNVFCLLDRDKRVVYVSPAIEHLFGITTGGIVSVDALCNIHPDERAHIADIWARVLVAPGTQIEADVRVVDGAGRWRTAEVVATNLLDVPGVGVVVSSFRDVTDRREGEILLRRNEARLRAIVEHSSDGLVLVDEGAHIAWVSPAVGVILGYDPADVVGTDVLSYLHPEDLHDSVPALTRTVVGRSSGDPVVVRIRHVDGSWPWIEVVARGFDAHDEGPSAMFSLRDVSRRVEAELAARQSEARFRTVMENSYDVVAVVGPDAAVKWITPNCARLLGWKPDEIEGRNGLDFIHPDDLDLMVSELTQFASGVGVSNPTTVKMLHRDGSWHHVEMVGTDFLDNPDVHGIALGLRGVDERMAIEEDRQRLVEIFELSSDLVLTMDGDEQLVYMNSAARRFFGIDPGCDVTTLQPDAWLPRDLGRRLSRDVPEILERNEVWCGEVELVNTDGLTVPFIAQVVGHRDREGTIVFASAVARDISERKAFETRLAHDATHDPLTGLPNRTMLLDRLTAVLSRHRRQRGSVAVLFLDLDNFKVVNDSMGHSRGDQLLAMVAERLRRQLRPEDTVGRFGGDEFVVVCEDVAGPDDAIAVAKRVDHAFSEAFDLDGTELFVGVSIGVVVADGASNCDPESLIRDADAAMYGAKLAGRNRFQLFEPGIREQAVGRFDLENALRGALGRHEFELHFQPIFPVAGDEAVGVEALVRWNHPQRGLLGPGEFIGVAEETGLIVPLGTWVLEEACRRMQQLGAAYPAHPLTMAVNISGRQLEHPEFVDDVARTVASSGIDPGSLHLEVTESVLMRDVRQSQLVLGRLKELGVHIAVDDFGTGYSSLSYLQRFPVDSLKVDRSFVDGLGAEVEDSALVAAIVNLAHTLGLVAVAEGVETEEQRRALGTLDCDLLQGYLLAAPMPFERLWATLAPNTPCSQPEVPGR